MREKENQPVDEVMVVIKKFGMRMRSLRKERRYSQEELAFRCGLDRTYVGGIERGERNPSLKNITKIAKALEVNISALFNF